MNTTEIKTKGIVKTWPDLWKYAEKQFLAYEKIEGIEDWEEHDFSIDCSEDQMRFKDMLQIRCVEELTEATHALDNEEHFWEEITDAINFFLSAYVMLGKDLSKMPKPTSMVFLGNSDFSFADLTARKKREELYAAFYQIVDAIGDLCNLLKNRPWAQSNYLVSMLDFEKRAKALWIVFWSTIDWLLNGRMEKIFDLFERKYLVNDWRIKTGY